ncbi:MAG TPA: hypothetical protein PKE04_21040, partial [Clostridia bacterium]|nr:hypothetical protein [Clostridia bacterium]
FIASLQAFGIAIEVPGIEGLPEAEASALLTQTLEAAFGGSTSSLTENMADQQKGRFDNWSLEEKARYTQLLYQHGLLNQGIPIHYVPDAEDLAPAEVEWRARAAVAYEYRISEQDLSGYAVRLSFCAAQENPDSKFWVANFRDAADQLCFAVRLARDGSALGTEQLDPDEPEAPVENESVLAIEQALALQRQMESQQGPMFKWSLEDKAKVFPDAYGIPNESEVQLDEALRIAAEAMQRTYHWTNETAGQYDAYAYFLIDRPAHYYVVNFFLGDNPVGSVEINASDGAVLNVTKDGNG